jgi:hypothetical protein
MAPNDINDTTTAIDEDVEGEELWCVVDKKIAMDASLGWEHEAMAMKHVLEEAAPHVLGSHGQPQECELVDQT